MRVIDVETAEIVRTTSYDMAGKIDRLLTEGVREAALKIFPEFEHPLAQVFVRSNPPGATITLDGEEMGTTPVILKRLESVLPHSISLALPSHLPFDTLFTLEEGLNPPLDIDLIHEQGYLTVDSRFVGWDVYINRHKIGSTPISSHSYPTGEYILKVKSPGFYPAEEPFTLTPDLDYKYFAELEPKSKRKAVLLSIVLPGAGQVYQGYSLKGIGLMSGTLLTGWLAVQGSQDFDQSRSDYEMKIDDYNAEQDPVEWESKKAIADQAFNTMKDDELSYQLRLALLGLLWTVNLIEVSF